MQAIIAIAVLKVLAWIGLLVGILAFIGALSLTRSAVEALNGNIDYATAVTLMMPAVLSLLGGLFTWALLIVIASTAEHYLDR